MREKRGFYVLFVLVSFRFEEDGPGPVGSGYCGSLDKWPCLYWFIRGKAA